MILLDDNGEINRNSIMFEKNNQEFKKDILITVDSNIERIFDMVLLNNYKQIAFSINNLTNDIKHEILITKTDELVHRVFSLRFSDISFGVNDCILLLIENSSDNVEKIYYDDKFLGVPPNMNFYLINEDGNYIEEINFNTNKENTW